MDVPLKLKVLIIDDEDAEEISKIFVGDNYKIAKNLTEAIDVVANPVWHPDLIILDAVFPVKSTTSYYSTNEFNAGNFLETLENIDLRPKPNVILVSGQIETSQNFTHVETWLQNRKIFDILQKGEWNLFRAILKNKIKQIRENIDLRPIKELKEEAFEKLGELGLYVGDLAWVNVWKQIKAIASVDEVVLITGEPGVGKESIATAIHKNSLRQNKILVTANCGTFAASGDPNILKTELFGSVAGFPNSRSPAHKGFFREAEGGTLFLDEIGELDISIQPMFLRAIDNEEIRPLGAEKNINVNVRLICATNRVFTSLIAEGKFRSDLFDRIHTCRIEIPPLRERPNDIPVIITRFLNKFNKKLTKNVSLAEEVFKAFKKGKWYGNVRELEIIIKRIVIYQSGEVDLNELVNNRQQIFSGYDTKTIFERFGIKIDVIILDPPPPIDPVSLIKEKLNEVGKSAFDIRMEYEGNDPDRTHVYKLMLYLLEDLSNTITRQGLARLIDKSISQVGKVCDLLEKNIDIKTPPLIKHNSKKPFVYSLNPNILPDKNTVQ